MSKVSTTESAVIDAIVPSKVVGVRRFSSVIPATGPSIMSSTANGDGWPIWWSTTTLTFLTPRQQSE